MTRSVRLLAVAVLAVVLALSSVQNVFASTEIAYDNGAAWVGIGVNFGGVLFSLPSGALSAKLRYVRWMVGDSGNPLTIHITGPDHVTELPGSPIAIPGPGLPAGTGCPVGWTGCYGYDLTSLNIVVTGDFYIILDSSPSDVPVADSNVPPSHRSFFGASLLGLTTANAGNFLIRVDIDPTYPTAIPEYPLGLPILAIFMVIGYVLIRRKTATIKQK